MKARALLVLGAILAGCTQGDSAYLPVALPPAYSHLPDAPPGFAIEPGPPVKLDSRQQEAVVEGVVKWMKDPASASFGAMAGARTRSGAVVVCGEVNGRNSAGAFAGGARFVGVLMGRPMALEFVVVSIAQSGKPRAEVEALCQRSGVPSSL
jgi:hypothetical protein